MNSLIVTAMLHLAFWSLLAPLTARAAPSPSWDWATVSPESQGLVANRLESIWTGLQARHTTAFLVIRDDRIIIERYATGYSRTTKHYTASLAKALVGGVSLAVALSD